MSRSVKKTPVCTDHETPRTRQYKRYANKSVRRCLDRIPNGKWYRKLFNSWNIRDYRIFKTKNETIQEWESSCRLRAQQITLREAVNVWEKCYKRK